MFMFSGNCGIYALVLALSLALVGAGWTQTTQPPSPDHAILYRRAVALLDQAQQKLTAGDLAGANSLVKQANSLFTLLQKEYAAVLAERRLSPQEDQQLAIHQKLATATQTQADGLMATAAAKGKEGRELEAQGQKEAATAAYRESKEGYTQAQNLSIKSAIYALRNQQLLFHFLAP
jgi:hypothetical protein